MCYTKNQNRINNGRKEEGILFIKEIVSLLPKYLKDPHKASSGWLIQITLTRSIHCSTYSVIVHCTVEYSTLEYSTVQYSTIQYSTVQYIRVQ